MWKFLLILLLFVFAANNIAAQQKSGARSQKSQVLTLEGLTIIIDSAVSEQQHWIEIIQADSTFSDYFLKRSASECSRVYISSIKQVGERNFEFTIAEIPTSIARDTLFASPGYSHFFVTLCIRIGNVPFKICDLKYSYSQI